MEKTDYEKLKEYRVSLEEMIEELEINIRELFQHAKDNENKSLTVKNCLKAAEAKQKRLDALHSALELTEAELLRIFTEKKGEV